MASLTFERFGVSEEPMIVAKSPFGIPAAWWSILFPFPGFPEMRNKRHDFKVLLFHGAMGSERPSNS